MILIFILNDGSSVSSEFCVRSYMVGPEAHHWLIFLSESCKRHRHGFFLIILFGIPHAFSLALHVEYPIHEFSPNSPIAIDHVHSRKFPLRHKRNGYNEPGDARPVLTISSCTSGRGAVALVAPKWGDRCQARCVGGCRTLGCGWRHHPKRGSLNCLVVLKSQRMLDISVEPRPILCKIALSDVLH